MIVMGIISYRVKQNLTIYIGQVLKRRGRGSLTGSICPIGRIGVATNSKSSQENICHGMSLQ